MAATSARKSARSRTKAPTTSHHDVDDTDANKSNSSVKQRSEGKKGTSSRRFKTLLGVGILALSISSFFVYSQLVIRIDEDRTPRVVTPYPAPKIMDLPQFQGEHRESLYWGTYRPLVYLGIRARTPRSLIAGLMWIGVKDGQYFVRHVCQDSDGLNTYGWTHHNGRNYGHQLLVDQDLLLETSFLKSKGVSSGYGGDWSVRLDVQSKNLSENTGIYGNGHLFFYVGDEEGNTIHTSAEGWGNQEDSLLAYGSRADVGDWQLHLRSSNNVQVYHAGFKTPHFHNLSDLVQMALADQVRRFSRLELPDTSFHSPNILVFQIIGKIPFQADVAFLSATSSKSSGAEDRVDSMTGASLSQQLIEKKSEFDKKFERCFNLSGKVDSEALLVSKAAIGNMLGGIGYFYGQSKISVPGTSDLIKYWPAELYTAVPSRSYFPRGFLWDEGFHQLLIWRWDINICLDVVGHWLDLMNIDGWIPREQILGAEALSKVPGEFVAQHPTNGNPPTLFLVLHDLISGVMKNEFSNMQKTEILTFLERASVRLDAWFKWFNTSQSGTGEGVYFWHGRNNITVRELNPKTLSSGLDDYPRASHPNGDERHLDLRCWMLLAADCMQSIEGLLGHNEKLQRDYGSVAKLLSDFQILNQMHFDDKLGAYFDYGNHTEKVHLQWQVKMTGNHASKELIREVLEKPRTQLVPQIGYVSLFPFMARIIPPDSSVLGKQLDLISNRSILWTSFGIRSLAKTSSIYMKYNTEHDPPYWRGPVWINMNYMILSALHHYSRVEGPYKERAGTIYEDLRSNLIRNIVRNYQKTGYLWEQYDQKTGKGKGTRPFTGWTTLVVLIMAEDYNSAWGTLGLRS